MVGNLFIAKIYFTDISSYKERPVLIIKELKDQDYLFLPLTTNLNQDGICIQPGDLDSGKLKKISMVIISKISIIHRSLIIRHLGSLKPDALKSIKLGLCKSFDCYNENMNK